ncbi:LysM peptidoglycan-binding domain-containing protein [Rhodocaloribacter litoris]|uniref:lytic transglycosylase n=1 Tax=Rhodocaloribacter litoris TaxID=2558931 RepID=UPI001E5283EB|nr:LysM peptidoglycan-binding domain-containing protein [Rhodocaloribacter litoris]QXD16811.1 LysM peptidoglycan-binding domain-containing protein [Rhodocaloribacter litoris]
MLFALSDTLSEAQILHRLARIYGYQSDLLRAQAEGDLERTESLLSTAMTELAALLRHPGILERPRFQELYRTLVAEYERYYGPTDTLTLPYGSIFELRAEVFALLNELDEPLLEDVVIPNLRPIEAVIPMTMNRLVESSIAYLRREPDRHIHQWLSRAETYFPMIEQILAEEGVPDELKYLAMIESGLNPRARSWAQAVGMWQFIAATGRAYGLHVDAWVDERMDPEKATRAAARHLRDLYREYGDWHIALAAYNCSPRCIRRAMRQAEERTGRKPTFWDMYPYLPRETRNYVPMFIATALMASNPDAFGLKPAQPGPRYAYHYVPVQGAIRLSTLAELAGTDVNLLRALNPELRRNSLPPSTEPYYLRLPLGTYERFAEGYKNLPEDAFLTAGEYVVRRGDTLGKIAAQYGTSVRQLMADNGLKTTRIHIGQRLVVPVPQYQSDLPRPELAEADVVTVDYGTYALRPLTTASGTLARATTSRPVQTTPIVKTSAPAPAPAREKSVEEKPAGPTRIVYTVRRGDTLIEIADRYNVWVADLKRWNNLRGNTIRVGQRLSIYTANPPADEPEPDRPEKITYRVRSGDTLSEIAARYGVSIRQLQQWNDLRGTRIRTGQRLTIYPGGSGPVTHRVQRGDTLDEIARRYGVSISDLKQWNNLRGSTIYPGQELTVQR